MDRGPAVGETDVTTTRGKDAAAIKHAETTARCEAALATAEENVQRALAALATAGERLRRAQGMQQRFRERWQQVQQETSRMNSAGHGAVRFPVGPVPAERAGAGQKPGAKGRMLLDLPAQEHA